MISSIVDVWILFYPVLYLYRQTKDIKKVSIHNYRCINQVLQVCRTFESSAYIKDIFIITFHINCIIIENQPKPLFPRIQLKKNVDQKVFSMSHNFTYCDQIYFNILNINLFMNSKVFWNWILLFFIKSYGKYNIMFGCSLTLQIYYFFLID